MPGHGAALRQVRAAAEQFGDIDPWATLLRYLIDKIAPTFAPFKPPHGGAAARCAWPVPWTSHPAATNAPCSSVDIGQGKVIGMSRRTLVEVSASRARESPFGATVSASRSARRPASRATARLPSARPTTAMLCLVNHVSAVAVTAMMPAEAYVLAGTAGNRTSTRSPPRRSERPRPSRAPCSSAIDLTIARPRPLPVALEPATR